jgi:hypothetical protein
LGSSCWSFAPAAIQPWEKLVTPTYERLVR